MSEQPTPEHPELKPDKDSGQPKYEADEDIINTTPKTSAVISDTLLNSILGLTGSSTESTTNEINSTISSSCPLKKPTDENIERKLSSLIILLSAPPTPDKETIDADDDSKSQLGMTDNLPREDIIKILKLSLMKIKQLNLNVQCLKEDTTSKVERLELERDLLIKEINFIRNRKTTENLIVKDISYSEPHTAAIDGGDPIHPAYLSPTNSPPRLNRHKHFHPESPSSSTKIVRKPAGQGYTFPKLHSFNSGANPNYQASTTSSNKQIKIVSTDKLSSGRRISTSQPSSPIRKRKESISGIHNNSTSNITNPGSVQFFHYYSRDAVVDVNDFQSLDNRRNKKRKRVESVSDVPTATTNTTSTSK